MYERVKNGFVSAVIAASLMTTGIPAAAIASESTGSLQARLSEARATYDQLALESAEVGEALNDTYYALDQTRKSKEDVAGKIEVTQKALDDAREVLGDRVAASYRSGNQTLLDMILGSTSIEEFVGAIYYGDKVAEQDAAAIDAVDTIQTQLEQQQGELTKLEEEQTALASQQEAQAAELDEAQTAVASYINGLDAQVRQQLQAQRAAEIAAQQAAARQALASDAAVAGPLKWQDTSTASQGAATTAQASGEATTQATSAVEQTATETSADASTTEVAPTTEETANNASTAAETSTETPSETSVETPAETATENETTVETQPEATTETEETSTSTTSSDDYRQAILEAAYSQLGVPYVYGGSTAGSALDCSGFTQYCYSQAGIDIPHSSVGQASMADSSSIDDLQAGDLVFWEGTASGSASGSHVAIYLGDGQIIHANGTEVAIGTLSDSYTSCGSIS